MIKHYLVFYKNYYRFEVEKLDINNFSINQAICFSKLSVHLASVERPFILAR
jgi:hypothetical protein